MLVAITLTTRFSELNIRLRKLKIDFLNMTAKGFKFNLTRHCDTLTIPLILKKSLKYGCMQFSNDEKIQI